MALIHLEEMMTNKKQVGANRASNDKNFLKSELLQSLITLLFLVVSGHSHLAHQQPQVIPSQQSSLPQPSLVGPTSSLAISQHPTIQSNVTGGSASHLPAQQINPIAATGQGSGSMSTPTVNVKSFRNNEVINNAIVVFNKTIQTDLIASTRLLILKDLRKAMNVCFNC